MITIELFGVPRLRAGVSLIRIEAHDIGSALRALAIDGRVQPSDKRSLNGDRFVTESGTRLLEGDVLLAEMRRELNLNAPGFGLPDGSVGQSADRKDRPAS